MYATRTRKVKTDRRGARALADACVLGADRWAHRLSDGQRQVRGRLLVLDAFFRTRTRYISVIRALLRPQGYRVASGSAEAFLSRSGLHPGSSEASAVADCSAPRAPARGLPQPRAARVQLGRHATARSYHQGRFQPHGAAADTG